MSDFQELIAKLKERFENNKSRLCEISWSEIEARLSVSKDKLNILAKMEVTGGEPAFVGLDETGGFLFFDCAKESPIGRRSYCYDRKALDARKTARPANDALSAAAEIGIELLDEAQYAFLQTIDEFDTKTSSWLKTPENVRLLGGAIFGDRRFERVFTYHNGAES